MFRSTTVRFVAVCICLAYLGFSRADEAPASGIVYNTKESHSIVYFCEKSGDNERSCEFTQTRVKKHAKPEDLKSRLARELEDFTGNNYYRPEECKAIREMADMFHGRRKLPKELEDGWRNASDIEKNDTLRQMNAMRAICDSQTRENISNLVRIEHDKDSRTCIVNAITFKQTFRLVSDLSGARTWVARGDPSGPCGIVQLSRFEPVKEHQVTFWNYIAQKAITNRQGLFGPTLPCKDLDEEAYLYEWKPRVLALRCDYIRFQPL